MPARHGPGRDHHLTSTEPGTTSPKGDARIAMDKRVAAEILLLARWFELRPKELRRTATPKTWLADGGIHPIRRKPRKAKAPKAKSRK